EVRFESRSEPEEAESRAAARYPAADPVAPASVSPDSRAQSAAARTGGGEWKQARQARARSRAVALPPVFWPLFSKERRLLRARRGRAFAPPPGLPVASAAAQTGWNSARFFLAPGASTARPAAAKLAALKDSHGTPRKSQIRAGVFAALEPR